MFRLCLKVAFVAIAIFSPVLNAKPLEEKNCPQLKLKLIPNINTIQLQVTNDGKESVDVNVNLGIGGRLNVSAGKFKVKDKLDKEYYSTAVIDPLYIDDLVTLRQHSKYDTEYSLKWLKTLFALKSDEYHIAYEYDFNHLNPQRDAADSDECKFLSNWELVDFSVVKSFREKGNKK